MDAEFFANKNLQEKLARKAGEILYQKLKIKGPTPTEIRKEATNLLIGMYEGFDGPVPVDLRIRRYNHFVKYRGEFTIRSYNEGHETELHKVLAGFPKYLFYGCASLEEDDLIAYYLVDLDEFRRVWNEDRDRIDHGSIPNRDGRTKFKAFRIGDYL